MKYLALFLVALLSAAPAGAQIKDSYYFMADDGEQSPEEVMEEAQYVFDNCDSNVFQRVYFDCQCLAGTFLQAREKLGGIAPQEEIINNILYGSTASCGNPVGIAGKVYENCMESARFTREYNKDNEEFCSCVGNTAAKRFTRDPHLSAGYIRRVQSRALVDCENRDDQGNPLPRSSVNN